MRCQRQAHRLKASQPDRAAEGQPFRNNGRREAQASLARAVGNQFTGIHYLVFDILALVMLHVVYIMYALCTVAVVIYCLQPSRTLVPIGEFQYSVVSSYPNHAEAAALIARTNRDLLGFMRYLRAKYIVDDNGQSVSQALSPNSDAFGNAYADPTVTSIARAADVRAIVHSIIYNYNPEVIEENDPMRSTDTSYTVDKGKRIMLCVRSKRNPVKLVDPNTLMFVVLHEVGGHIGNYNGWQHTTRFWTIFKFVLHEAAEYGIYKPVDYARYPAQYCGITIDYQPLYDKALPNLWLAEGSDVSAES